VRVHETLQLVDKKNRDSVAIGAGVGIAIGAALGLTVFDNLAIGLGVGVALGTAIGAGASTRDRSADADPEK
jgi:hypothetical protein